MSLTSYDITALKQRLEGLSLNEELAQFPFATTTFPSLSSTCPFLICRYNCLPNVRHQCQTNVRQE